MRMPRPQPWRTDCPDWEARIMDGRSLVPCPPPFPDEAELALRVFREFRLVELPGAPSFRDTARPWVLDFVAAIFGTYDRQADRRLASEFFLLISKKNGKSTVAAGIMLAALILNWRVSAEFLILAPTIEVANNSFFHARDMVRADPELSAMMHIQDHYRMITHRGTGATLKVVAAATDAVSGKKASVVLVEELWQFGNRPGAENMLREATGGLASRPEGFVVYITTQSDRAPAGIFKQKLDYARQVRDGTIHDPKLVPILYEFPRRIIDASGHLSAENFAITNPNIGVSVSRDFLERQLAQAREMGPHSLAGFAAKHLNIEIGLALAGDRWSGADFWPACLDAGLGLDQVLARAEVVTVGIDGGGLDDLLGLAVLGREAGTDRWLLWARAWVHPIGLERRKSEAPAYRDMERAGDLVIIGEAGADVVEVGEIVKRIDDSRLLDRVGVDPVGIGDILDEMRRVGIADDRVVGIPQGWRMSGAIKTTERRLADGAMVHGGQALMAYAVGNAKVEKRGNADLITKQISGAAKIDPLIATLNAVALMMLNPTPRRRRSIYEERGVLVL